MRIRGRMSEVGLVAMAVSALLLSVGATPASAGIKEAYFWNSTRTDGATVWVIIDASSSGGVRGTVDFQPRFSSASLATSMLVYVLQCDGYGHNCGQIVAIKTEDDDGTFGRLFTSKKAYSPGHVYKACASVTDTDGWRLINACSDFAY